jgi:glycosyltransferase involved in cell wall biosynthesis
LLFPEKNNNKNNENNTFTNQIRIIDNKEYNDSNVNKTDKRLTILSKGRNYIDNCLKEVSFNNFTNYAKVKNPLISVIIPVYNCERTIKWAIKSIQKQNITEIEIILVNDFSKDASLSIITELQKTDLRISIINNKKNYGTLYSRCVGTLISKGKFIFALDNDDMFFAEDVFDYISKKAMKDTYDIVGFKSVYVHSYNSSVYEMKDGFFTHHKNNLILHQPELGRYPIYENGRMKPNDYTIWGKCIKTEIYKQAVNSLGIKRYSTFVSWGEDTSIVFVIFNIAQSFIFVHKYGIMHIQNSYCASQAQPDENILFGEIFFIEILFDFSKNNTDKVFSVNYALYTKRKYNLKRKIYKNVLLYLKNVLNKIMNSTYITKKEKDILKLNFNYLIS